MTLPANDIRNVIGARRAVVVAPSDTTVIEPTRGLFIGTSGDVTVDFLDGGTQIVLKNMTAGGWHPMVVTKIWNTGTLASNIVAGY